MTDNLTFYTNPMSRGRIVRWMLEECGAQYRTELLDYGTTMKAPEYLAINPMGKVPALKHGDTVITEVGAICTHLADVFPQKNLAPAPGTPERGAYLRWLFFCTGPFEAVITAKTTGHFGQPMQAGYGTLDEVLNTLEQAVRKGPHLISNRFTTADLIMAAFLNFYMEWKLIDKRPAFEAYCQPHIAREAAKRANAIDDELMPKQG